MESLIGDLFPPSKTKGFQGIHRTNVRRPVEHTSCRSDIYEQKSPAARAAALLRCCAAHDWWKKMRCPLTSGRETKKETQLKVQMESTTPAKSTYCNCFSTYPLECASTEILQSWLVEHSVLSTYLTRTFPEKQRPSPESFFKD